MKLEQLGFSSYEAKAYFALIQKHPANGYEISKIAKIPPAKVYETLNRLKNKGAVIDSNTVPVKYYPVPPETLLSRIKKDFITTLEDLEVQLQQVQPFPDIDLTWNLTGYKMVLDKIVNVIDNAATSLLLSVWPNEAVLIKEHITKAEERGVKVVTGLFGDYDLGCKNFINLEACGASSEKRLGKRLTVVVSDSKEVVISEIGEADETVGVWTTTPGIVLVAKEYIKHDIWGRILVDAVGEARFKQMCDTNELLSYLIKNR